MPIPRQIQSYGGGAPEFAGRIKTVWPLKEGDTYTVVLVNKVRRFKVIGFVHDFVEGWCPQLEEM